MLPHSPAFDDRYGFEERDVRLVPRSLRTRRTGDRHFHGFTGQTRNIPLDERQMPHSPPPSYTPPEIRLRNLDEQRTYQAQLSSEFGNQGTWHITPSTLEHGPSQLSRVLTALCAGLFVGVALGFLIASILLKKRLCS